MNADANQETPQPTENNNAKGRLDFIDIVLLGSVLVVLVMISCFLVSNMNSQNKTYNQVIDHLMSVSTIRKLDTYQENGKAVTDTLALVDHQVNAAILSFARAKDFANIKLGSTLLGFLLIFVGALYLLKVFNLGYKAALSKEGLGSVSLQTTSPGLVMITLGVVIAIMALVSHNEISYSVPVDNVAALPADTLPQKQPANATQKPIAAIIPDNSSAEIAALKQQNAALFAQLAKGATTSVSYSEDMVKWPVKNNNSLFVIPDKNHSVILNNKTKKP